MHVQLRAKIHFLFVVTLEEQRTERRKIYRCRKVEDNVGDVETQVDPPDPEIAA